MDVRNMRRETAREMASSAGYRDIVQLLDEHREGKKLFDIF